MQPLHSIRSSGCFNPVLCVEGGLVFLSFPKSFWSEKPMEWGFAGLTGNQNNPNPSSYSATCAARAVSQTQLTFAGWHVD